MHYNRANYGLWNILNNISMQSQYLDEEYINDMTNMIWILRYN